MMKQVLTDPSLEKHLHGHESQVSGLCFDSQSKYLVSSSHDHSLMLWNLNDKRRGFKFMGHTDVVSDVCFSPVGELLASSSYDRTVRIWTPSIKGSSGEFRAHTKAVQSVHFSYDGLSLLTSSNDKSIKEWSVKRKTFLSTFTGHNNWVRSARFSHDAKIIVTASDDKNIKLFDHNSHVCIHTFNEAKVPRKAVFHPNDTWVAAALTNKTIKVYDLRILKQLQLYQCHENDVTSVEFHTNGNYLFSVSLDGTTKIIDLLEGRTIYTLEGNRGPLTSIATSSDGNYFALGGLYGQILLWKVNFEQIKAQEDLVATISKINIFDPLLSKNIESLHLDEDLNSEKENIHSLKELNLKLQSNDKEPSSDQSIKNLSSRVNSIYELSMNLLCQINSLDERCRKLENLYLNSDCH